MPPDYRCYEMDLIDQLKALLRTRFFRLTSSMCLLIFDAMRQSVAKFSVLLVDVPIDLRCYETSIIDPIHCSTFIVQIDDYLLLNLFSHADFQRRNTLIAYPPNYMASFNSAPFALKITSGPRRTPFTTLPAVPAHVAVRTISNRQQSPPRIEQPSPLL